MCPHLPASSPKTHTTPTIQAHVACEVQQGGRPWTGTAPCLTPENTSHCIDGPAHSMQFAATHQGAGAPPSSSPYHAGPINNPFQQAAEEQQPLYDDKPHGGVSAWASSAGDGDKHTLPHVHRSASHPVFSSGMDYDAPPPPSPWAIPATYYTSPHNPLQPYTSQPLTHAMSYHIHMTPHHPYPYPPTEDSNNKGGWYPHNQHQRQNHQQQQQEGRPGSKLSSNDQHLVSRMGHTHPPTAPSHTPTPPADTPATTTTTPDPPTILVTQPSHNDHHAPLSTLTPPTTHPPPHHDDYDTLHTLKHHHTLEHHTLEHHHLEQHHPLFGQEQRQSSDVLTLPCMDALLSGVASPPMPSLQQLTPMLSCGRPSSGAHPPPWAFSSPPSLFLPSMGNAHDDDGLVMCPYHSGDGVDVDVGMGGGGGGVERGGEEQEEDTAGNPSSMNHTSGLRLQSVSSLSEGVLHGLSLDAQDVALLKKMLSHGHTTTPQPPLIMLPAAHSYQWTHAQHTHTLHGTSTCPHTLSTMMPTSSAMHHAAGPLLYGPPSQSGMVDPGRLLAMPMHPEAPGGSLRAPLDGAGAPAVTPRTCLQEPAVQLAPMAAASLNTTRSPQPVGDMGGGSMGVGSMGGGSMGGSIGGHGPTLSTTMDAGGPVGHNVLASQVGNNVLASQRTVHVKDIDVAFLEHGGYFDMPIQQAANKLQVGVTTLKKVCRQGGVTRWPFRKRSSLDNLIEKTARFIKVTDESTARHKELALAALQQQKLNLQQNHSEDILPDIKRYRQSIFKINYKLKQQQQQQRARKGGACQQGAPRQQGALSTATTTHDNATTQDNAATTTMTTVTTTTTTTTGNDVHASHRASTRRRRGSTLRRKRVVNTVCDSDDSSAPSGEYMSDMCSDDD